jgi:hypothetical protein
MVKMVVSPSRTQTSYQIARAYGDYDEVVASDVPLDLRAGWHTAVLLATGDEFRGYVDGESVGRGVTPYRWPGSASFGFFGSGTALVDWVLVCRP